MWPISGSLPGIVTSIASFSSLCLSSASLICALFSAIFFSMSALISFASWPITGLSSAESLPICFKIEVSSPFLPRYLILASSICSFVLKESSAFFAAFLISSSSVFIKSSFRFLICFGTKKYLPLNNRDKYVNTCGTTLIFAKSLNPSKHSLSF